MARIPRRLLSRHSPGKEVQGTTIRTVKKDSLAIELGALFLHAYNRDLLRVSHRTASPRSSSAILLMSARSCSHISEPSCLNCLQMDYTIPGSSSQTRLPEGEVRTSNIVLLFQKSHELRFVPFVSVRHYNETQVGGNPSQSKWLQK